MKVGKLRCAECPKGHVQEIYAEHQTIRGILCVTCGKRYENSKWVDVDDVECEKLNKLVS